MNTPINPKVSPYPELAALEDRIKAIEARVFAPCPTCHGTGRIEKLGEAYGDDRWTTTEPCPHCAGVL